MQPTKHVVISALAIPLILSLFSLSTPAKAELNFFQHRSSVVGAEGIWPTLSLVVVSDPIEGTGLFGFAADGLIIESPGNLPTSAFQATPNLRMATLSPVTVLCICSLDGPPCGSVPPGGTVSVTIQATWSASGPPAPSYGTFHFGFKGVEFISSGGRTIVPATATGALNSQNLGQSEPSNSFGSTDIFKATSLTIKTCPSPVASGHTGQCGP